MNEFSRSIDRIKRVTLFMHILIRQTEAEGKKDEMFCK